MKAFFNPILGAIFCLTGLLPKSVYGQNLETGFNFFPLSVYKLRFDANQINLPDDHFIKTNQNLQVTLFEGFMGGLFLRYNQRHFTARTEINFTNRYFRLGDEYKMSYWLGKPDGAHIEDFDINVTYFNVQTPVWAGYTLNPRSDLKFTLVAGICPQFFRRKAVFPIVARGIGDSYEPNYYDKFSGGIAKYRLFQTAGIECKYFGTTLQILLKRNTEPLVKPAGLNSVHIYDAFYVSTTLGFSIRKGGPYHRVASLWKVL